MVSGRVVKTVMSSMPATGLSSLNLTSAPSERPIQLFCMASTRSGQPPSSSLRSFRSSSA